MVYNDAIIREIGLEGGLKVFPEGIEVIFVSHCALEVVSGSILENAHDQYLHST